MKKILFALATIGLIAIACAAFAQGAFVDVPTDHWAYDAVNQLQRVGIIVGYPDGTFGGKRAMTRYEFAVAIARLLPLLNGETIINNDTDLSGYAKKSDIPAFSGASKGDLDALRKLVNEFGDELASLGVDVDALKRDVANLTARVEALEAENRRIRFTGDFFAAAKATKGLGEDYDGNVIPGGNLLDNVAVYKNFDLNIVGRPSSNVTVYSTINYGDYLNEYSFLGTDDDFYPTYLYAVADLGKTTLTAGRFPMQWTPYTIKSTDYDSYIDYAGTDDGNYALDGVKADLYFGKAFNVTMFAAKNDQNRYFMDYFGDINGMDDFDQSAGARANFGLGKAALGVSYYESWAQTAKLANRANILKVYGADLKIPFGGFCLGGEYAKSKAIGGLLANNENEAWEVGLGYGCCNDSKLGFKVAYKDIGQNFNTAGNWGRIGRYFNPLDIKGWDACAKYDFGKSFGMYAKYQDYDPANGIGVGNIKSVGGGLNFNFGAKNSFGVEYERVINKGYRGNGAIGNPAKSTFTTLTYNYKFNPNANFKIGYQFITDKNVMPYAPVKADSDVAFAQFSVSF